MIKLLLLLFVVVVIDNDDDGDGDRLLFFVFYETKVDKKNNIVLYCVLYCSRDERKQKPKTVIYLIIDALIRSIPLIIHSLIPFSTRHKRFKKGYFESSCLVIIMVFVIGGDDGSSWIS